MHGLVRAAREFFRGRDERLALGETSSWPTRTLAGRQLTRAELREELDRFRDEMLRDHATTADFANLKSWIVGILLVAVLNVVRTAGVIVAAVLTG